MRTSGSTTAWLAMPVAVLLATVGSGGGFGRGGPVAAVVIEEGGGPSEKFIAQYRVKVTADHPDFKKGDEVRIFLTAKTKVVQGTGKDARAARPGRWAKGIKIHFSRYDGIQQSRPPNVHPGLIVLGGTGK